jgi:adenylyltransferase/sulfurtransferase
VQVRVPSATTIDLEALGRRLDGMGDVLANPYLVRFREAGSGRELTVFPDGRAIIKGTSDPAEARVMYARFIGT